MILCDKWWICLPGFSNRSTFEILTLLYWPEAWKSYTFPRRPPRISHCREYPGDARSCIITSLEPTSVTTSQAYEATFDPRAENVVLCLSFGERPLKDWAQSDCGQIIKNEASYVDSSRYNIKCRSLWCSLFTGLNVMSIVHKITTTWTKLKNIKQRRSQKIRTINRTHFTQNVSPSSFSSLKGRIKQPIYNREILVTYQ